MPEVLKGRQAEVHPDCTDPKSLPRGAGDGRPELRVFTIEFRT